MHAFLTQLFHSTHLRHVCGRSQTTLRVALLLLSEVLDGTFASARCYGGSVSFVQRRITHGEGWTLVFVLELVCRAPGSCMAELAC